MAKIHQAAAAAFYVVWAAVSVLILDEELGIHHVLGMQPITIDSLNNLFLFLTILAAGPAFTAWWAVHVYRRKYGDLKGKE